MTKFNDQVMQKFVASGQNTTELIEQVQRKYTDFASAKLGTLVTEESLIREIELEARLDTREFDGLLKRLSQLKAAKTNR